MKKVRVIQYGGSVAEKVVVEDMGDVLLLTTETEWDASIVENRVPISIGFRREYVVDAFAIELDKV